LPSWRERIRGGNRYRRHTMAVRNLENGEADISVRYVPKSIRHRGTIGRTDAGLFLVVASPQLVEDIEAPEGRSRLGQFPLIEAGCPASDMAAANLATVETAARNRSTKHVPHLSVLVNLNLREEPSAIEAAISLTGDCRFAATCWSPHTCERALVRSRRAGCQATALHRASSSHPKLASSKPLSRWALSAASHRAPQTGPPAKNAHTTGIPPFETALLASSGWSWGCISHSMTAGTANPNSNVRIRVEVLT